jgi:hypothetical protein
MKWCDYKYRRLGVDVNEIRSDRSRQARPGRRRLTQAQISSTCNLLLTDKFFRAAAESTYLGWPSPPAATASDADQAAYQEYFENRLVSWKGTERRSVFEGLGHLMFAWLFAVAGGLVARNFVARDRSDIQAS